MYQKWRQRSDPSLHFRLTTFQSFTSVSKVPLAILFFFFLFFFLPLLWLSTLSPNTPPVELGECDFSKGVSTGLEGCSSGCSEGASQTFHLRSYAPEGLCSLERQLACQVASCAMKAWLLLYCSFLIGKKNTLNSLERLVIVSLWGYMEDSSSSIQNRVFLTEQILEEHNLFLARRSEWSAGLQTLGTKSSWLHVYSKGGGILPCPLFKPQALWVFSIWLAVRNRTAISDLMSRWGWRPSLKQSLGMD